MKKFHIIVIGDIILKKKLLSKKDRRISPVGVVIIKSQSARTQEANRNKALIRLRELIKETMELPKFRHPTSPTRSSKEKRLQSKGSRSQTKKFRRRPGLDD